MVDSKVRVRQSPSLSTQTKPLAEPEASAQSVQASVDSEHDVRIYAHELYERRGGPEDHSGRRLARSRTSGGHA
jgi:hypothetical protein